MQRKDRDKRKERKAWKVWNKFVDVNKISKEKIEWS